MYLIIAFFSSIIRELINNPFEGLIDLQNFQLSQLPVLLFVYQYWPIIMHMLIFGLVGVLYKRAVLKALQILTSQLQISKI